MLKVCGVRTFEIEWQCVAAVCCSSVLQQCVAVCYRFVCVLKPSGVRTFEIEWECVAAVCCNSVLQCVAVEIQ